MARHLMFDSSHNVFMSSLSFEPGEVACRSSLSIPGITLPLLTLSMLPRPVERAPFPWMWLGSGSSSGWRCSVTGISGCHDVSRRCEKAKWWAGPCTRGRGRAGPGALGKPRNTVVSALWTMPGRSGTWAWGRSNFKPGKV